MKYIYFQKNKIKEKKKTNIQYLKYCSVDFPLKIQPYGYLIKKIHFYLIMR